MSVSQQLSGINAISYFSAPIFQSSLPPTLVQQQPDFPKYLVAVTGLVANLVTLTSVFTVERIGRKRSHLIGLAGMAVCSLAMAILLSGVVIDDQTCHGLKPTDAGNYSAIVVIIIFVGLFSMGPGSVPWLIAPELFTSSPRPTALAIVNTSNWLCNFGIALGFDPLRKVLCGWIFLVFFTCLVLFTLYLYFKLPNVEGKSVNEIASLFYDEKREAKNYLVRRDEQPSLSYT